MSDLFANVEFPREMDLRVAAVFLGLTEQRTRTLLRNGTIPCTKDDSGRWIVTREALENYQKQRANAPRGGGQRGDGKMFQIRVKYADLEAVKKALAQFGIELAPRYNYEKQREYQARKKAEKAKVPASAPAPAPTPTPAPVAQKPGK